MAQLKYTITHSGSGWENFVIDLPAGLTIQERKLHRSCMDYTINGGYVFDTNQDAKVKIGTCFDGWAVRSAIRRGRNMWMKMHKELFENNPGLKPKWHDYKAMLVTPATSGELLTGVIPQGGAPTIYRVPEDIFDVNVPHETKGLTYSKYTSEDHTPTTGNYTSNADEFTAHVIGETWESSPGNVVSYGLIDGWVKSRPDLDPITTVSDSELDDIQNDALNLLFNDGDADNEIIENFHNSDPADGDQEGDAYPMYNLDLPMNLIQERAAAFTTSSNPVSYFTGFNALLGQVFVRINTDRGGDIDLMFDVDPRGRSI